MRTMPLMWPMRNAVRCPSYPVWWTTAWNAGSLCRRVGAVYNFTGPQGFGVANMADALYAIKTLVFDEHKATLKEFKEAMATNYGKGLTKEMIGDMTAQIAAGLKAAGKEIGEKEITAIMKTVIETSEILQ